MHHKHIFLYKLLLQFNYFLHSKINWFHSLIKPKVSSTINPSYINIIVQFLHKWDSVIAGNSKRISTSKIANTKATRKKCKEKDIRCSLRVENPHSNGLCSSRSHDLFLHNDFPRIHKIKDRINILTSWIIRINITCYEYHIAKF